MSIRVVGGLCALALGASTTWGVVVQGTELAPYTAVSNQLGTSHGVWFSSANYPAVTFTELIPGTWGVYGAEPWALPSNGGWFNAPIIVDFVDPNDGVSPATVSGTVTVMWGDGGGDFDAVDMRLYDASNNLISTQTFSGFGFTQIQMTAVGIRRVEFWANTNVGSGTSDTGFDWISYPTPVGVPAPGAAALLGLSALASRQRRRSH
jgi:MYXO-CTERM domain-containing protein